MVRAKVAVGIGAAIAAYFFLFKRKSSAATEPDGIVKIPGASTNAAVPGLSTKDPDFYIKPSSLAFPSRADIFTEPGSVDDENGVPLYGPGF